MKPTKTKPVPVQAQALVLVIIGLNAGDTTLPVPGLDSAAETDDRSDHSLLRIGLVVVPGLGEVRHTDVAPSLDGTEHFLRGGFVVELEVIVDHLTLTLASDREMLRTQVFGHESVLVTVEAVVGRIVVVDQRLAELAEDEDLQVIGQ